MRNAHDNSEVNEFALKRPGLDIETSQPTLLLIDGVNGDRAALDRLLPLIHAELRKLAAAQFARERPCVTLQPTVLVHELYLRLIDQERVEWRGRAQFFALCAGILRQMLVDHARKHQAAKYGGGAEALAIDEALICAPQRSAELLALDDALRRLASTDERKAQVVELRFFGGLTNQELAQALGVSENTVIREWTFARAWLRRELS